MARATLSSRREVARVWRLGRPCLSLCRHVAGLTQEGAQPLTRGRPHGRSRALVFPMQERMFRYEGRCTQLASIDARALRHSQRNTVRHVRGERRSYLGEPT